MLNFASRTKSKPQMLKKRSRNGLFCVQTEESTMEERVFEDI